MRVASEFVEDEGDATDEEIVGCVGGFEDFCGSFGLVRSEEDAVCEEVDVADGEVLLVADGVEAREGSVLGVVGREGVVVAVEDDDGVREQDGVHAADVGCGEPDGDEALPLATGSGASRAKGSKGFRREVEDALNTGGADVGFGECDGVADKRDLADFADLFGEQGAGVSGGGKQVRDDEVLRTQDFVQRGERELTSAVQEVGQMGLTDASLPCE